MYRIVKSLAAIGLLLAAAGVPAMAQRDLGVPATSGWKHALTGFVLRARLAGYPRASLQDGGDGELDIMANFIAPDQSTFVTVYLFRPSLMSVPVWFDRSETQIFSRDTYGGVQPVAAPRAFAPPAAKVESGLRRVYVPNKSEYKSTGLAVMPMGEWLVAIRISSNQFDAATLETKLDEVIGALGWPDGVKDAEAAVPVAACATPLTYAKRAKLQKPSMSDALMGAALSGVISKQLKDDKQVEIKPMVYCRDAPGTPAYAVYRDSSELGNNSYVMALGDAGRTVTVEPSLAGLVSGGTKGYQLSFGDLDKTLIYPSFDKLASPDQALDAVKHASPMSSASRGADGGSNITISTGN